VRPPGEDAPDVSTTLAAVKRQMAYTLLSLQRWRTTLATRLKRLKEVPVPTSLP